MKKPISLFWRRGLWALTSIGFFILFCFGVFYVYAVSQLPDVDSLKTVHLQVPLQIYSRDGKLIQEYGEKKRIPVTYDAIPPMLVRAVLATEDQRFFDHPGVDVFGLARAAVRMAQTGTKSQGGSTITMQVARNFFLERKKTFFRKFNEILLAIKIDNELSKEKILELYLNKIYLGNRAYGVAAAAQVYYGKTLKELTLPEIAMIAGLPQAPSSQNPIANPKAAIKRRNHVLSRLLENGFITQEAYDKAIEAPNTAKYHGTETEMEAPYVAEMIRQSLYEHFGPDAYTKGYKVYTTIRSALQENANAVVKEHLMAYDKRHGYRGPVANVTTFENTTPEILEAILKKYPVINGLMPAVIISVDDRMAKAVNKKGDIVTLNWAGLEWARPALKKGYVGRKPSSAHQVVTRGDVVYLKQTENEDWILSQVPQVEAALVALNPKDGAIEALVGGFDFARSKFNRATQADRQPGSCFKPFIYAGALNKGYTLATIVNDAPIAIDDPSRPGLWRPQNANDKFGGPTRLKAGLTGSKNLVSIRILNDIGIDYAIDFVTRFGFQRDSLPRTLSLALGTLVVSPLDLAAAYAVFANTGFKVEPYLIDKMVNADGDVILQATPAKVPSEQDDVTSYTPAPRVISKEVAFLMNTALKDVIQSGTAQLARSLERHDIAGKTGTTNDKIDAWFAGYNPNLVVTTWVGYDSPISLHEYASQVTLPLWIDFMRYALKDTPEVPLEVPEDIIIQRIDPKTGLATSKKNAGIEEYFRKDLAPGEIGAKTIEDVEIIEENVQDNDTKSNHKKELTPEYLF